MPYKHTPYILAVFLICAGLAFWPNYLSRFDHAPASFHLHGFAGTVWILLLIIQSAAIHRNKRALHKALGAASLFFMPLYFAASIWVAQGIAVGFVNKSNPVAMLYGPGLSMVSLAGFVGFFILYTKALKERAKPAVHGSYMVATILLFAGPVFSRIGNFYIPGLMITGPETMGNFSLSLHVVTAGILLVAFYLSKKVPGSAPAYGLVAAIAVMQSLFIEQPGPAALWQSYAETLAAIPTAVMLLFGACVGLAALMMGRRSGIGQAKAPLG